MEETFLVISVILLAVIIIPAISSNSVGLLPLIMPIIIAIMFYCLFKDGDEGTEESTNETI